MSLENNDGMEVVRTEVRKYFMGNNRWLPIILILVGIPLCFIVIGYFLILIGIGMIIYDIFAGNYAGQEQVDQAVQTEVERLSKRGMEKLNLIAEDTNLVSPICLRGFGVAPDANLGTTVQEMASTRGILGFLNNLKKNTTNDPVEAYRIGSDERLRSMLLSVTTFMFTEDQLLVYSGNVDISTSKIYNEQTSEIFYKDISSVDTFEVLSKQFNPKKKSFLYYTRESIALYGNGIKNVYSFRDIDGNSVLNNQFVAMKNLIRDKKKA